MTSDLVDVRVLVAEDELLIALDLELRLLAIGCRVIGPFARLRQVMATAETETVDIALLDMNLNGELVLPAMTYFVGGSFRSSSFQHTAIKKVVAGPTLGPP